MAGLTDNPRASARAAALRLLKVRPRSERELADRLSRRGCAAQIVRSVVEDLKEKGLLDDAKFARYYAIQRMDFKPMGRRALERELRGRGVAPELAARAVEEAAGGQGDFERACELARRRFERMRNLPRPVIERRLFGFLSRRGFSSESIYRVLRELSL